MPTYTDTQRQHAIHLAQTEGAPHAAKATGIHPATIRRWAKHQGITPADTTDTRADTARANGEAAKEQADEARQGRIGTAQARLARLVEQTGDISSEAAEIVAATMGEIRVTQGEAVALSNTAWKLSDGPERLAKLETADVMWRRVRVLSDTLRVQALTFGLSIDKLAKLAGEDGPLPSSGSVSATVNLAMIMEQDPEFRATVIAGAKERIDARRALPVGSLEVPDVEA